MGVGMIRRIIAVLPILIVLAIPAHADFKTVLDTVNRGDNASANAEVETLAKQGALPLTCAAKDGHAKSHSLFNQAKARKYIPAYVNFRLAHLGGWGIEQNPETPFDLISNV